MLDKLPEVVVERLLEVSEKIGAERAMIALQGLVALVRSIQIIDGVLRQETVDAVNKAIEVLGLDSVLTAYDEKIKLRFPDEFKQEAVTEEVAEE